MEIAIISVLIIFGLGVMCYLVIKHGNGGYIKIGQVYRLFNDPEFKDESPYKKNYKDYQIIDIKYPFCLAKDLKTNEIKDFNISTFAISGKLKK